ncbi:hypothetical protein Q7C36_010987 [Tachysurus vachellii]|uniref:Cilia- and flagella-associated protein 57-like n=1 Tax=Tachysurus vachellii TaxID=175792 RepID=A0AA88N031_TACVA|nr:hypothetical protein Q7C36_010987 [Tachysurus vachellii]
MLSSDFDIDFSFERTTFSESSPEIKPCHSFGVCKDVKNNLLYQDEETVIFPSGKWCVSYNVPRRHTKFIHIADGSIQALALCPDRRYLAVSESNTITVFDLKDEKYAKIQTLMGSDYGVEEFVCMAFSADSKYLLGQARGPTWSLFYWQWEEKDLIARVGAIKKGLIRQVSFNPEDDKQVCVSGKGVFKIFELNEDSLKHQHSFKMKNEDVLCHTWMSGGSIVAGTEAGELLLLKSKCLNRLEKPFESNTDKLDSSPSQSPLTYVTAIVRYSKGFACSAGQGLVCLYEETEQDNYRKYGTIRIPVHPHSSQPLQAITTMCISPSEEMLAISTDQGQLYHIRLRLVKISKNKKAEFKYLSHCLHSGSITGMSVCAMKPLIATCSKDCTVHIWNYSTKNLVQFKEFDEEPLCVSIHPNSLSILVGFSTEICLMNLMKVNMRTVRTYPIDNCTECVFNHDGNMFASINRKIMCIVNVRTREILQLRGHCKPVQSVKWNDDDTLLVSCGPDGMVYVWDALTGLYTSRNDTDQCYVDVTFSPNNTSIVAVAHNLIHEISHERVLCEMASDGAAYTAISVTHLGRTVFVGTAAGTVRVLDYPFEIEMKWKEHQAHSGPITKMAVTPGDQYLLTASKDGSLFIWSIIDENGRALEMVTDVDYTEEVLCTKEFLKKKDNTISELKLQIKFLEFGKKFKIKVKDINCNERIQNCIQDGLQQVEALKEQIRVLNAEREDQTASYENLFIKLKEQLAIELKDHNKNLCKMLLTKFKKHEDMKQKLQLVQETFETEMEEAEKSHLRAMKESKQDYEAKLQELQAMLEHEVKDSEEKLRELKGLTEREIMDLYYDYEQELEVEKEIRQRLQYYKKEMASKILTCSSMKRVIQDQSCNISKLEEQMQILSGRIQAMTENILDVTKEKEEQSHTIAGKESSIGQLNKIIENLEKSLEEKKEELDRVIFQARTAEEESKQRSEQERAEYIRLVKEMEENKETFKKISFQIKQKKVKNQDIIAELKRQLESKNKALKTHRQTVIDGNFLLNRMKSDIHSCSSFIQDPKKLRKNFTKIYKQYIKKSWVKIGLDPEVVQKQTRQTERLSKMLDAQAARQAKEIKIEKTRNCKIVIETSYVIQELKDEQLKHRHVLKSIEVKNMKYDETGFHAISVVKERPVFSHQRPETEEEPPIEGRSTDLSNAEDNEQCEITTDSP